MRPLTPWKLLSLLCVLALGAGGCAERMAGQVELLSVGKAGTLQEYGRAEELGDRGLFAKEGEAIRSNHDVITLQVEAAYIQNLPFRLTGSHDVIIFADVWENGAMAYNAPSLTSIAYIGTNQKVPGRLNLRDNIAYGPTTFKGHPLKIRFTMMVLQKAAADRKASMIDVLSSFISAAAPQYSPIASQAAKTLQNILKAQPDIKFFDFEVTFTSDRPEGLEKIIPAPVRQQSGTPGVPSTGFEPPPPGGNDRIHWLRYGRYALVETESYDGQSFPVVGLQTSQVNVADAWLFRPGGRLPTSYIVFRLTPGQIAEDAELLRAAAEANATLLASLQRSPKEIATALKEIQASADELQEQVLQSKAESIALRVYREATLKTRTCAVAGKDFDNRWADETRRITDAKQKQRVAEIGTSVKARWAAKCEATTAAAPSGAASGAGAATGLANPANQETLKEGFKGKRVPIEGSIKGWTFTIDRVAKVSKSADDKPVDTVEVDLKIAGTGTEKVPMQDVQTEIVKAANKAVADSLTDTSAPIKNAKINNKDDADLKNVWKP